MAVKVFRKAAAMPVVLILAAVLLSLCLLAAACGNGGGEGSGKTGGGEGSAAELENRGDVDAYLQEIDSQVNSVDPGDFSADQLDDSELGL